MKNVILKKFLTDMNAEQAKHFEMLKEQIMKKDGVIWIGKVIQKIHETGVPLFCYKIVIYIGGIKAYEEKSELTTGDVFQIISNFLEEYEVS